MNTHRFKFSFQTSDESPSAELIRDVTITDWPMVLPSCILDVVGDLGHDAAPFIPAIVYSLQNGSYSSRLAAVRALGKICPKAKEVIDALRGAQQDTVWDVRCAATEAIQKISLAR